MDSATEVRILYNHGLYNDFGAAHISHLFDPPLCSEM